MLVNTLLLVIVSTCSFVSIKADKPILINSSANVTIALDENIIISCSFESAINMTITWLKDDKPVQINDRIFSTKFSKSMDSLNIKNLENDDKGTYTCVGINKDGVTKANVQVDLIEIKPNILKIDDVYLRVGQSLSISCSADAVPMATYEWKRIGGVFHTNFVDKKNGILKITSAKLDNDGAIYQCTASNSVGSTTQNVKINVIQSTTWLSKPNSSEIVDADTPKFELVFSFATSGTENPKITWYKDSIHVSNDVGDVSVVNSNVGAKFTSRLYFKKLNTGNSGIYKIIIDLKEVSEFSHFTNLTVRSKPVIEIDEGKELYFEVGTSATFTCIVNAFPQPTLTWRKNETELLSSSSKKNLEIKGTRTTFVLNLGNIELSDAGIYSCYGENSLGNSEANIKLNVMASPVTDGDNNKTVMIVVIVVSIVAIVLIILAVFLYIRYKDRWCKNPYEQANGKFYTDLVQEEKDASCLADIENNPYAIKKNINISMKRGDRSGTIGTKLQTGPGGGGPIRGRSLKQSIKQGMSIKRPGGGNQIENHYARLDTVVCQGKPIDFKHIVFDECLGAGEYGLVNGGRIIDDENATVYKEVSIKMLKDDWNAGERRDMLAELRMMRRVSKHKNVIMLIGWCIADDNVYVVEEFVPFGNLLTFLRAQRCLNQSQDALDQLPVEDRVDEKTLLSFAVQIASGMKHLASLQVVHRDVACRNVYLGYEKTCKISEYGLTRDIYAENVYRKTTGGQLPVRWMAREAVFEGQYTTESDIWSFGILMWELITLGKIPYPGIVRTEHLLDELESGYHMENPGHISTDTYLIMSSCWNTLPSNRPSFDSLVKKLNNLLNDDEEVHIDVGKLLNSEIEDDMRDELMKSPNEDFHRPHPFNSLKERPEEEEEEEQRQQEEEQKQEEEEEEEERENKEEGTSSENAVNA